MPRFYVYLIFVFSLLCPVINLAGSLDTLKGKILDENLKPLASTKLEIAGKFKGVTTANGSFSIYYTGTLKVPLNIKLETEKYRLIDYLYLDDEDFVEINVEKVKNETIAAKPKIDDKPKSIIYEEPEIVEEKVAVASIDTVQEQEKRFEAYKVDLSRLVFDLKEERLRMEKANLKIRDEITLVSNRLKNEHSLSEDQRVILKKYIEHLENTVLENTIAFTKTQEKTNAIINTLKQVIAEKDSLQKVTEKKLAVAEKEKEVAVRKLNRNLIIFSVISFSLLLLAVVFYTIAYKMKRQKNNLVISNSELIKAKGDLFEKMDELEKQKAVIEEQNNQLDAFVYKVSHDIKGPLNTIRGLATVGEKANTLADSIEIFEKINSTATKLGKLVVDLLDLSKEKVYEIERHPVNFKLLVEDCLERLKVNNEQENLKTIISIPDNICFNSDERILLSIFQNLIENAYKYTDQRKPEQKLSITITDSDSEVIIKFSDNGLGIPDEHLSKVFDMFYKINPSSTGSGLGLYMTRQNVEKLGGKIKLESKDKVGTIITIAFQKAKAPTLA